MNIRHINNVYKELGIGTEEERKRISDINNLCSNKDKNEYYFIRYSPTSSKKEEILKKGLKNA